MLVSPIPKGPELDFAENERAGTNEARHGESVFWQVCRLGVSVLKDQWLFCSDGPAR